MRSDLGVSAAWVALLPDDTVWLSGQDHAGARELRRAMTAVPPSRCRAVVTSPWSFRGATLATDPVGAESSQTYVAFPSCEGPILVASRDAAVLRYVADSVLSVPPGAGRVPSMVLTAGLRLLRLPIMWTFAGIVRAAGVVRVRRAG
jgi:hypothetical protein